MPVIIAALWRFTPRIGRLKGYEHMRQVHDQ
jgi:hypothetical protein